MSKIYIASTLNNPTHDAVAEALKKQGHQILDYRHPPHQINPLETDTGLLDIPARAAEVLASEKTEISNADLTVAIYPFGLSVAAEIGFALGVHTKCMIYAPTVKPEFDLWFLQILVANDLDELLEFADNPIYW